MTLRDSRRSLCESPQGCGVKKFESGRDGVLVIPVEPVQTARRADLCAVSVLCWVVRVLARGGGDGLQGGSKVPRLVPSSIEFRLFDSGAAADAGAVHQNALACEPSAATSSATRRSRRAEVVFVLESGSR